MADNDWMADLLKPATQEQVDRAAADMRAYRRSQLRKGVATVESNQYGMDSRKKAAAKILAARRKFGAAKVREALKHSSCLPY